MADSTTSLGLVKPEVGASADTWGTKLNGNFDIIDAALVARPATAQAVGVLYAGLNNNDVGMIAMAKNIGANNYISGVDVPGADCQQCNAAGVLTGSPLPGTWRTRGRFQAGDVAIIVKRA